MTMSRPIILLSVVCCLFLSAGSQQKSAGRPKLVVGLVVDQMRWDFLYRFEDRYGNDGFKRLLREGFSCENSFIPYMPSYTAAGHACVYTGSVPAMHGIMGNSWYNRTLKRNVYCVEDDSVSTVGGTSSAGKMSPANLWGTTITDEVRMAQNFRNKTVAISLKDRGAILPGGHTSNQSYWFDNRSGGWISSSFYMQQLPQWVTSLNQRKLPDAYLKAGWNTLYPINTYKQSSKDSLVYESNLPGEDNSFPHLTESISNNKYETFRYLPAANTFTLDLAKAAVENEKLGRNGTTDFLAISFSTPDYIGHAFGPNSIEVEDCYLRLDKDLGAFLKFLDATVGKDQYLVFLTADHGVAQVPAYAREHKMPAGAMDDAIIRRMVNDSIQKYFSVSNVIESVINYQFYLNNDLIASSKLDAQQVRQYITKTLVRFPFIAAAYDFSNLDGTPIPDRLRKVISNSYNQKLSGDILFIYKPQWFDGWDKGSTHGTWNPYDTHIPLVWFGWNIKPGRLYREVYMTDIAATLAALLKVQMPSANVGEAIYEIVR
jgi:predicted AlkP superfamily pyrophosphatase or phosphodiesterase